MSKFRFLIPATVALAALVGGGVAHARDADVQWSVTIGSPGYTHPGPVYAVPAPVYRPVVPVYRHLPVPAYPATRYAGPTRWDRDGDGIPNRQDRFYNPAWDRDGDGIPNRQDRFYNPAWDRDGDGIPNHRDRTYNPRGDRDRDGVPNRWDRHDRDGWRR